METKKNNNIQTIIIFVLIGITVASVIGIIYLLKEKTLIPDYAPGVIDGNAVPISGDVGGKTESLNGGGSVSLSYSNKVSIDLEKKEMTLYFKNPSRSNQSLVIQVIVVSGDKEIVIAQSERIPTGYAIYKLGVSDTSILRAGGYNGKFNVIFYDENSGEKAIVNTNIPITIAVN